MNVAVACSLMRALTDAKIPYVLLRDIHADSKDVDLLMDFENVPSFIQLAGGEKLRLLSRRARALHKQ